MLVQARMGDPNGRANGYHTAGAEGLGQPLHWQGVGFLAGI
jgi:hypothetical protein